MASVPPKSAAFPLTAVFFSLALALGGAGTRYPLLEMGLEVASIALIFYFAAGWQPRTASRAAIVPLALVGLIILVPVLQLMPLPPAIWQDLPGRERAVDVLTLIGRANQSMPLSLDPEATRRSAFALLPGIAMVTAVIHLSVHDRLRLVTILLVFAILGATLGALQIASGGGAGFSPFATGHRDYGVGLFTNRNHQADFLLIAIALAAATGRIVSADKPSSPVKLLALGAIGLFAAGVLATTSRTGAALLVLVLPAALALLYSFKFGWRSLGIGAAGLFVAVLAALNTSAARTVIERFAAPDDPRFGYWRDTLWAIRDHAPVGSGLGTFVPVHQSVESLSTVVEAYANHAHNDYLQLALEGGALALVAFVAFALFLGLACRRLLQHDGDRAGRLLGIAALIAIVVILLHSVVDYPLRMLSLIAVFGLLCGLLVPPPAGANATAGSLYQAPPQSSKVRKGLRIAVCAAFAAVLLVQAVLLGLADQAVKSRVPAAAASLAPWSADAASRGATENLMNQDLDRAEALAVAALARSPLDVRAMSTLALVYEQQGRALDAARLMAIAATGGWRDLATQLWLMDKALQLDDHVVAVQRADALLRQDKFQDRLFPLLREISPRPAASAAIAERLADEPRWRSAYLGQLATLTSPQREAHEAILLSLAKTEAPPTEAETAAYVRLLIEAADTRRAQSVWQRLSRPAERESALLEAGSFEGLTQGKLASPPTPFEWGRSDVLDASVTIDRLPGSHGRSALHAEARNGATGILLKQLLVLPPGMYRMSFMTHAGEATAMPGFEWGVKCVDSNRDLPLVEVAHAQASGGWVKVTSEFRVTTDCTAQRLELRATGRVATTLSVWFDDLRINPAAALR